MNVRKERNRKESKKARKLKQNEPTIDNELRQNYEQESIVANAKKYLMDINKQFGDDQSYRNYRKLISDDTTLAEWNHHHISSKKSFVNIPDRQNRFSFSKDLKMQTLAKESMYITHMNSTCRQKGNSSQITSKFKSLTQPHGQNIRIHKFKTKSPIKTIEMKQIDIGLNTPQKQNTTLLIQRDIAISLSSKSSKIMQKRQRQRLAWQQRLYGIRAEEHANKYKYIFKGNKSRKFQLPVHSFLTNQINKINQLISSQNVNFQKI